MEPLLSFLVSHLLRGRTRTREASSPSNILEKKKLLHLFVAAEHLGNHQKFVDALAGKRKTIIVSVPGSKSYEELVRPADVSRLSAAKVITFVFFFHERGYSFGGNISAEDLVLTSTGDLRAILSAWDELIVKTDVGQRRDAFSVARMIRHHIFSATDKIPEDIENLLCLLENYTSGLTEAVLQHPSLKAEVDALTQFQQLYMEFQQLAMTQPEKYKRIVRALPYCEVNEFHWKLRTRDNDHLWARMTFQQKKLKLPNCSLKHLAQIERLFTADASLKKFMHPQRRIHFDETIMNMKNKDKVCANLPDPKEDRAIFFSLCLKDLRLSYGDGGEELIKTARNCGQHMVESCSLEQSEAGCIILFKYFQILHIFGFYFPKLFCDFFLAMHAEGCVTSSSNKTLSHLMKRCQ